jgi:hypothetical protein
MDYPKFSHKTPHLKGKQHQLDPNIDLKQLVKHATIQYVDWDNDGDVDEYDKKPKLVPDENPTANFGRDSKKLIAKQKGEVKHTKRGMAYEQKEEKRYCRLCDKKETRSECSYGPKMWDKYSIASIHPANESKDHEHSMARSELATIEKAVKRLKSKMKGEGNIEAWVQSKITKAADYIDSAADYLDSGEHDVGESVSFSIGSGHRTAQRKEKSSKISSQGSTEGERTAGKKAVQRMGGTAAELPTIKKEEKIVDKILQEIEEEKKGLWANIHARREKGLPKKKPGQKGYPKTLDIEEGIKQARKNVGASKCWTGKKLGDPPTKIKNGKEVPNCVPESITIEDANGNTFAEITDVISIPRNTNEDEVCAYCGCDPCECEGSGLDEAVRIPTKSGNLLMVVVLWRGKTYGLRVFFPQTKMPNKKEVEQEIQKIYPDCKVTYFKKVEREPGQPFLQVEGAAWTKKAGKSESGGLNERGRRSYEAENPGSDLKAPSKKVGNKRRDSFCARMKGMKKKLTSKKTANDPNSRINKSLRAWNC